MRRLVIVIAVALIAPFALGPGPEAGAESDVQGYQQIANTWSAELLAPEELDDLLAPIALYPDPLIAQILPAATFIDQIRDAARHVRRYGTSRVDYQRWDLSVRAVAHYPKVLYMMEREFDWTASLGQAFVEQPQDVMDAIQRLRDYASEQGNLYTTREQQVIYEADIIRIVPARPQYLYLPVYDPGVIYVEPYSTYPFITFSTGFIIGAWLNRDCDWRQRRVYYHGWRGDRGWVQRARPHIRDRRDIYINRRASVINVNSRVVQHDTRVYRQQLRNEGLRRRDERRLSPPPARIEQQRPGRIEQPRPGRIEQRPGVIEQPRPGRIEQRPGRTEQPRSNRLEQQRAPAGRKAPAATGQQRRPATEGQGGESRRRVLRQTNRPTATQPPATAPLPGVTPVPRSTGIPVPGTTVTPMPRPTVTPAPTMTPSPTITPAPAPSVAPAQRAVEPAAPSRRGSDSGTGNRSIQPGAPSGTRAPPR